MDVIESLTRSYLGHSLSPDEVKQIAAIAVVESHPKGHPLVKQFDKNCDLLIVLEGKVKIISHSGEELAESGPGSVLGEVALLDEQPRSASVVCGDHCKIAIIPSAALWGLLMADAVLARTVLANIGVLLCKRLRAANQNLDSIVMSKHQQPLGFWWYGL